LDTDLRVSSLKSFLGLNPSGHWTLFLADLVSGEEAHLTEWALVVTGYAQSKTLADRQSVLQQ
jgi:subtilisin-like proprotein convertase family protein